MIGSLFSYTLLSHLEASFVYGSGSVFGSPNPVVNEKNVHSTSATGERER